MSNYKDFLYLFNFYFPLSGPGMSYSYVLIMSSINTNLFLLEEFNLNGDEMNDAKIYEIVGRNGHLPLSLKRFSKMSLF